MEVLCWREHFSLLSFLVPCRSNSLCTQRWEFKWYCCVFFACLFVFFTLNVFLFPNKAEKEI